MANTRPLTYYKPLMVKLEPSLKRRLKQAAADHDTDMSKITRLALIEYLAQLPPAEELDHQVVEEVAEVAVASVAAV